MAKLIFAITQRQYKLIQRREAMEEKTEFFDDDSAMTNTRDSSWLVDSTADL